MSSLTKLHFQIERWMKEKAIDADKINLENEQQAKLVFWNKHDISQSYGTIILIILE